MATSIEITYSNMNVSQHTCYYIIICNRHDYYSWKRASKSHISICSACSSTAFFVICNPMPLHWAGEQSHITSFIVNPSTDSVALITAQGCRGAQKGRHEPEPNVNCACWVKINSGATSQFPINLAFLTRRRKSAVENDEVFATMAWFWKYASSTNIKCLST